MNEELRYRWMNGTYDGRLSILINEFGVSPEEAEKICVDNWEDLPDEIKENF